MCFLPLKSSHYPSRPVPVPELFGKYPTHPVPKSKTPTRQTLPVTHGQLETLTGSWKMMARIRMFRRLRKKLALIACLTASLPPTPPPPPLCHSGSAKFPQIKSFRRRCDSRNLNLSPFCTLNPNEMLPKWQPEVNQVIVENDKRIINPL